MGEAKSRARAFNNWQDSLTDEEKYIYLESINTYKKFVEPLSLTGACYRLAIFLSYHLLNKHNIQAVPVVGYINDGTDKIMISHAWLEYKYMKTDISLFKTEEVENGSLIILDKEIFKGKAEYSYHYERETSEDQIFEHSDEEIQKLLLLKREEHQSMSKIAADREIYREYLDNAPDGLSYSAICSMIER